MLWVSPSELWQSFGISHLKRDEIQVLYEAPVLHIQYFTMYNTEKMNRIYQQVGFPPALCEI